MSTEMEKVNHPQYYNQHPSGVECIDIIRNYVCNIANALKYLWRAGLKGEEGLTPVAKEVEDLQKAVWYIHDFIDNYVYFSCQVRIMHEAHIIRLENGRIIHREDISRYYVEDIGWAIQCLWDNGVVVDGMVVVSSNCMAEMIMAINSIECRIKHLQNNLKNSKSCSK